MTLPALLMVAYLASMALVAVFSGGSGPDRTRTRTRTIALAPRGAITPMLAGSTPDGPGLGPTPGPSACEVCRRPDLPARFDPGTGRVLCDPHWFSSRPAARDGRDSGKGRTFDRRA